MPVIARILIFIGLALTFPTASSAQTLWENGIQREMTQQEIDADANEAAANLSSNFTQYIKTYRDQVIETKIIEFNGKKAVCDSRSRLTLTNIVQYLTFLNDPEATINWKGPDGYYELTLSDVEGLVKIGGAWVQKAFNAEKTILQTHAITPYTDLDSAKADFDTLMEE